MWAEIFEGNCTCFFEGNWTKCCEKHDKRYMSTRLTKWQADKLLYRCVKKQGHAVVAGIMFAGVAVFGHWNYYKAQKEIK